MKWCKTGTFLLLFLGACIVSQAQNQTQPQEAPDAQNEPACECEAAALDALNCYKMVWDQIPYQEAKDNADLGDLRWQAIDQDKNMAACLSGSEAMKKRGCGDRWWLNCLESCESCAMDSLIEGILHATEPGQPRNQRVGAIFLSFFATNQWGENFEWIVQRRRLFDRMLAAEEDPLVLAALLYARESGDDFRPSNIRRTLELTGHPNGLVSNAALHMFFRATKCSLLTPWMNGKEKLTPEILAALGPWYETWLMEGEISVFLRDRTMAVTIDDLPLNSRLDRGQWAAITGDLLEALKKHKVPAIGFVNSGKCEEDGKVDPDCQNLLVSWLEAGMELGNHTRSHPSLHKVDAKEWLEDVQAGETWLKPLVEKHGQSLTYFRHPYLHTGRSAEIRKETDEGLKAMGYTVAPVSIDNSEWIYAFAYDRALLAKDQELADRIGKDYLRYMEDVVAYYEDQSLAFLGYEIDQTLLLHANRLNGDYLDELLTILRRRGYYFIPLSEALKDFGYEMKDEYYGGGGITWLHRWALTQGKKGSFFSGEPDAPAWVKEAAEVK